MKWRRYRFYTNHKDYRPAKFNPRYPWWKSGETGTGNSSIIIAYLPMDELLENYWDDAFGIDWTDHESIEFSDRFPKPDYYTEL